MIILIMVQQKYTQYYESCEKVPCGQCATGCSKSDCTLPEKTIKTVGNNGTMPCSSYCSSGWNNEAPKGSICVDAINTNTDEESDCSSTNGQNGLICTCKQPTVKLSRNACDCNHNNTECEAYILPEDNTSA